MSTRRIRILTIPDPTDRLRRQAILLTADYGWIPGVSSSVHGSSIDRLQKAKRLGYSQYFFSRTPHHTNPIP